MKTLIAITICLSIFTVFGQKAPAVKIFTSQKLPDGTQVPASKVHAVEWSDREGKHVLITTKETGTDSLSFIVTRHYAAGKNVHSWWEGDSLRNCAPAATAEFIEPVFRLTDLDNDSVAEIWMMYRKKCSAEGLAAELVLVMREGENRYLFAGHEAVKSADGTITGGDYAENSSFASADPKFHALAKTIWHEQTKELAE